MAKTKISEFSATPANNTDIDSINIAEGCAPSGINDAIRELMAQLKDFQTGAQGDSFNGPVGTSTAAAGAFTTLSATGAITSTLATGTAPLVIASTTKVANLNVDLLDGADWASPAALGSTTPAAVSATTLSASGATSLTGSATIFNSATNTLSLQKSGGAASILFGSNTAANGQITSIASGGLFFSTGDITQTEKMRITAGGDVGIGTSSPSAKLQVTTTGIPIKTTGPSSGSTLQDIYVTRSSSGTTIQSGPNITFDDGTTNNNITVQNSQGNLTFWNYGAGSWNERMRLDSSGNLGLGVTPSAWQSTKKAFQIGAVGAINADTATVALSNNTYVDSAGTTRYLQSSTQAAYYYQNSGQHVWMTAPSGTAGNAISFTQAMTLDASGRWLLGTTTGVGSDFASIRFNSAGSYPQGLNMVDSNASASGSVFQVFRKSDDTYLGNIRRNSTGNAIYVGGNSYLALGSGDTERARIDSSGRLLVGTTTEAWTNANAFIFSPTAGDSSFTHSSSKVSGDAYQWFVYNASPIGSITQNGTTGVLYNTSSDYRLKSVIGAVTGSGERIDALEPVEYEWKANGQRTRGFLAHRFQEVYAGSVTGTKDAVDEQGNPVYQAMQAGSSEVIADLVAEIKSLRKRLADAGIA